MSCYYGHDEVVQVLLDTGMKVGIPDKVSIILIYNTNYNFHTL